MHPHCRKPVLVGHSAGGGLAQYCCSEGLVSVSAIVLVASYPASGGWTVHLNWAHLDPMYFLRYIWHGCDPNSPLSSPQLVKQAFFSPQTTCDMEAFFKQVNPEESLAWPLSMMLPFADTDKVNEDVSNGKCE